MQQRQRGLVARLRTLEHLAEELAHDLKGPGQRMGELAALVRQTYKSQADERVSRWLTLIEQNSKELEDRVEGILAVARVGSRQETVCAIDPAAVVSEVLKWRAGSLTAMVASAMRRARIGGSRGTRPATPGACQRRRYARTVFRSRPHRRAAPCIPWAVA
jgi:light-regulated signal transduction histidine kinase (bacteriophytochrome)